METETRVEIRGRTEDRNGDGSRDRNESNSGDGNDEEDGNGDGIEDGIGEGGQRRGEEAQETAQGL